MYCIKFGFKIIGKKLIKGFENKLVNCFNISKSKTSLNRFSVKSLILHLEQGDRTQSKEGKEDRLSCHMTILMCCDST